MSQSRTTQENGLAAIVSSFLWGQPIDTDFWYFRQEARILRPRMRKEVVLPSGLILATQMHASFRMSSRSVKKSYRSLAISNWRAIGEDFWSGSDSGGSSLIPNPMWHDIVEQQA